MATKKEKEQLLTVLKFTPRTYKIQMWGYGGEKVMGTVDRKIYDYFKHRRLDLSSFAWDGDYAEDNDIPEDMWPFPPGSWYDCDDMGHVHGVSRNAGTLQIEDENGETVYQRSLEDLDGYSDDSPELSGNEEIWIDEQPPGTVVFLGSSNEKGTFFEAEIPLKQPFNITKLTLCCDEIDGEEIINSVTYDGEEIDNWGGSTDGKSSDFGFYIAHSQKETGKWVKYTNMDDIEYKMSEWFPKKIKPVYRGIYMVKTAGKNSWTHQAKWTGEKWVSSYTDEAEYNNKDYEVKVKEWQGLASDPDTETDAEADLRIQLELDEISNAFNELNFEQTIAEIEKAVEELGEQVNGKKDLPQVNWPFPPLETALGDKMTTESKSKWWTVRTHYKKSCEQHEYFVQREGDGRIKVTDGFRFCEYSVETNDGEFPKFEFTTVPGGDGKKDSLDMNSLYGDNIESSDLVEMFDGGCWGDTEITGIDDEEEVERLQEFVSENGSYALEDEGDWYLDETEVWVWGPLEVEDEDGNVRIIIADEDGNVVDFVEEDN
jgi:hypothetical protein